MADRERKFTVSIFAPEGDLRQREINIQDSLFDAADPFSNRLKFVSQPPPSLSVLEQQIVERLRNSPQNFYDVLGSEGPFPGGGQFPNVSADPSTAPFPIGCPTGFFQQGNVCVPIVGTYPDETTTAPPGGMGEPKGVIQFIRVTPSMTQRGKKFTIQVFFANEGGVPGRFFIRVTIQQLNLLNQESSGVLVPKFRQAVLHKDFFMPMDAPLSTILIAQIELLHLSTVGQTGELVVDDSGTTDIPSPETAAAVPPAGNGGPVSPPPSTTPPPAQCPTGFELNADGLCIQTVDVPQCPTGYHINNAGLCVQDAPTCPQGTQLQNGICVQIPEEVACPAGYTSQNGICVQKPCPAGYVWQNGVCIPQGPEEPECPSGYHLNDDETLCLQDAPTQPACPAGTYLQNGVCINACPPGHTYQNGVCIPSPCPQGYHRVGDNCVQDAPTTPNCPAGYHAEGNLCVQNPPSGGGTGTISCPQGYHPEGQYCVQNPAQCPPGYTLQGNVCIQSSCPTGYHLEGNLCLQNTTTSPPPPSSPPPSESPPPSSNCNSSRCSNEFNGSCGTECNDNPNNTSSRCRDCIATCCDRAFTARASYTRRYYGFGAEEDLSLYEPASLTLQPSASVADGQPLVINGFEFIQNEKVDITISINWHGVNTLEGRQSYLRGLQVANHMGIFRTMTRIPQIPPGGYGFANIVARGLSSGKVATETIDIT